MFIYTYIEDEKKKFMKIEIDFEIWKWLIKKIENLSVEKTKRLNIFDERKNYSWNKNYFKNKFLSKLVNKISW